MKIGFIGLGIMGESMAANLIKKNQGAVAVFDVNTQKVNQLVQEGAIACSSSLEVVEQSDVIFTSVPKAEHVTAIHESVYEVVRKGQIFIDMSTISPFDTQKLAQKLSEYGAFMLDAPVVKSKQAAIDGTLGIYVGGSHDVFLQVKHLLECIGSAIEYMGDNGTGSAMKICHNMLVGEIQNGVNEMMILAQKLGIDWQKFQAAIAIGGAKNFYLETKAEAIGTHNFTTAFSVDNMQKDVGIACELIAKVGLDLPGTQVVQKVYQEALEHGLGAQDFAASVVVVENRNKEEK